MQDNCFDRIVISEFLELGNSNARRNDDPLEVHDADLVPKAANSGGAIAGVQREIDQSEYRQHEEEEGPSANQNPKQHSRTFLVTHTGGLV